MWNDRETNEDLLNFTVVADTIAEAILDNQDEPISIGVSGSWGIGKSSMLKLIRNSLDTHKNLRFLFIEFNAWLYQGYDDARISLLHRVSQKLLELAEIKEEKAKTIFDKIQETIKRISWHGLSHIAIPLLVNSYLNSSCTNGLASAVSSLFDSEFEFFKGKESRTIPKDIEELRFLFKELLEKINIHLVILVDDLDRCLPETAISTLEAMRLLLFINRTSYIIAADEQMIRKAVCAHFKGINIIEDNGLVTSYFDKLIQLPVHVPRLGQNEVKCYLMLLLAEKASQKGTITSIEFEKGKSILCQKLRKAWGTAITQKELSEAFDTSKMANEIMITEQIAPIMATSQSINGNPRLIKRFLHTINIRQSIAKKLDMSESLEAMVKMLLFERCAPLSYLKLQSDVSKNGNGFSELISSDEAKQDEDKASWAAQSEKDFVVDWEKLKPQLVNVDLRPLLYLSRSSSSIVIDGNELSSEAQSILEALYAADLLNDPLIKRIQELGKDETSKILTIIIKKAEMEQYPPKMVFNILHIIKAYPDFAPYYTDFLLHIPDNKIPLRLIPLIKEEEWAAKVNNEWNKETSSSKVKKAYLVGK